MNVCTRMQMTISRFDKILTGLMDSHLDVIIALCDALERGEPSHCQEESFI